MERIENCRKFYEGFTGKKVNDIGRIDELVLYDNYWFDFSTRASGDIVDLIAYVKYKGDKQLAIKDLEKQTLSFQIKYKKCESKLKRKQRAKKRYRGRRWK